LEQTDIVDEMLISSSIALTSALFALANAQAGAGSTYQGEDQLLRDPGVYGPALEVVHLYFDQFPTGIAVSREGRRFSNYPGALDPNNTYRGETPKYTIAELLPNNTERAWPSAEINQPPGGAINYTTYPPTGANYADYLIGSQSIVIDSLDRAWILDTGRVATPNGTLVASSYGGPKLVGVNLSNNTVFKTILFPPTVAYPDSYLNDLRPHLSGTSGQGIAYITDSSTEGRNGIVMADLGTGESWRHLDGNDAVHIEKQHVQYLWGEVIYANQPGLPFTYLNFGSDGIALGADGEHLYWKSVANRYLFSIPTVRLRDRSANSEVLAQGAINNHGQSGISDGMETDTNGFIYHGNMEQNAVSIFNPANGTVSTFVRDPRLNWIDTVSLSLYPCVGGWVLC
jgi:sugar lactone lactonase YvrE